MFDVTGVPMARSGQDATASDDQRYSYGVMPAGGVAWHSVWVATVAM